MKKKVTRKYFARIIGESAHYQEFTRNNLISFCMLQNVWVCNNNKIRTINEYLAARHIQGMPLFINLIRTI